MNFFILYSIIIFLFTIIITLFLPGYILSYTLFNKISLLERIIYSFTFSILLNSLMIFFLNMVGLLINKNNVIFITILNSLICLIAYYKKIK